MKGCRLLSGSCNYVATPLLGARSTLKMSFEWHYCDPFSSSRLHRYYSIAPNFSPLAHPTTLSFNFDIKHLREGRINLEAKALDDISHFVSCPVHPSVRRIKIYACFYNLNEWNLWTDVISKIATVPNITQLDLSLIFEREESDWHDPAAECLNKFVSLTNLTLYIPLCSDSQTCLVLDWMQSFHSIQSITLPN